MNKKYFFKLKTVKQINILIKLIYYINKLYDYFIISHIYVS